MPLVKKAVESWDRAAVEAFQASGKATVEGHELSSEDVLIKCVAKSSNGQDTIQTDSW